MKMNRTHAVLAVSEKSSYLADKARLEHAEAKARGHKCKLHPDQVQYHYCKVHAITVCPACCLPGGKHHACGPEAIVLLKDAAANVKADVSRALQKAMGGQGQPAVMTLYAKEASTIEEQQRGQQASK
jgi:hypothetical protein